MDGEVIGVNSQIESESGGNVGIGFAVPSNTVEKIADALITDGSVEHAYLGVAIEDDSGSGGRDARRGAVGHARSRGRSPAGRRRHRVRRRERRLGR